MAYKYVMGMFDDEVPLLKSIKRVREAGYKIHDVLTPFPVHGLDTAMQVKETRLHTAGFVFGALGTATALFGMSWVTNIDWPVNIGGKPDWALPAFIPITFELTVLFASIGMVVVFYLRNGFSIFKDPEILDPKITDDRFAMVFDTTGLDSGDADRLARLLKDCGVVEVKTKEMTNKVLSYDEQS